MRAIAANRFGGNDVLELTEVPDPIVGPDTVLVRTKAVGLNPVDWKSVRGGLAERFPTHLPLVPGWDVAGVDALARVEEGHGPGKVVVVFDS